MPYEQRTYRSYTATPGLFSFSVAVGETDLFITASTNLAQVARDAVLQARLFLEQHIKAQPFFQTSLVPLPIDGCVPGIIKDMLEAAADCSVGPMAAVAGAVAEYVGHELLKYADEVIVENGGDIFLQTCRDITMGVFAGTSPLSERIGIRIPGSDKPWGFCTSSGTVGPSLSFGKADAVTVKSRSAAYADAAATAIGNMVITKHDIHKAIEASKKLSGIDGVLIIKDDMLGIWGDMHLVQL
jgi:hypothetical protein